LRAFNALGLLRKTAAARVAATAAVAAAAAAAAAAAISYYADMDTFQKCQLVLPYITMV